MSGFIDIILLFESLFPQPFLRFKEIRILAHGNVYRMVAHSHRRGHPLGQSIGIAHHKTQPSAMTVEPVHRLLSQYLLRSVGLTVLYMSLISGWQHGHGIVTAKPAQIVIQIPGIVGRITHHEQRRPGFQQRKHQRSRRSRRIGHTDTPAALDGGRQRISTDRGRQPRHKFFKRHYLKLSMRRYSSLFSSNFSA